MKPNKKIAALAVAALATSGVAAITLANPAQASTQTFHLYSQTNNTASSPVDEGLNSVKMIVSPTSGPVGSAITVEVSSTTLALANGPAAAITNGGSELDAVISLGGVDYTLRGSRNGQGINKGVANSIFNAGWKVSSDPGGSSSTSTNTVPATGLPNALGTVAGSTGIGASVRGAEGTAVSLVAPATSGTYTIGLKAIVNNGLTTGGPAGQENAMAHTAPALVESVL